MIFPTKRNDETGKVAGTLRRAVRSRAFTGIPGGRHMECAYYFDFGRLCRALCLSFLRLVLFTLSQLLSEAPHVQPILRPLIISEVG